MNDITMLGIDLAKNVFQLHGVGGDGRVIVRRQVRRLQLLSAIARLVPKTVVMEACAGTHEWGRRIAKMEHQVRLIAPQFVKAFVKSQDRSERCRSDLRGGAATGDALCGAQDG